MASEFLFKLKTRSRKIALYSREHIDLEAFSEVRPRDVVVETVPFPHFVVDDFFKPEIYQGLSEQFKNIQEKGFLEGTWSPDYFHRFDIDYDGYVYSPPPTLDSSNPTSIFFSLEWNWFFSKIFKQFTAFETMMAFHHHPIGDRTGFVHHDNADKTFSLQMQLSNGVVYSEGAPPTYQSRRKIALLYFLNNDGWEEGDGGEIGLYSADKNELLKKVAPINNRLLAFQISPLSMHAFQQNHKERNSIVQWFHVPGEYA